MSPTMIFRFDLCICAVEWEIEMCLKCQRWPCQEIYIYIYGEPYYFRYMYLGVHINMFYIRICVHICSHSGQSFWLEAMAAPKGQPEASSTYLSLSMYICRRVDIRFSLNPLLEFDNFIPVHLMFICPCTCFSFSVAFSLISCVLPFGNQRLAPRLLCLPHAN